MGLAAGLASPSTFTVYGSRPELSGVLFLAVSQSGGSPDLVDPLTVARECGALTVAVTNNPSSPLAEAAELSVDVRAGAERAVAATKTYTSELLALALLLAGPDGTAALPEAAAATLANDAPLAAAARYRFAARLITTARGYSYPTAREAALKIMETSYLPAHAFSGADLLHGPLAMVDNVSPVIAIVTDGRGGQALQPVLDRLRGRGADLVVVGPRPQVEQAVAGFALPAAVLPEELQPVLEILPLQRLAYEVTMARGQDPDAPRSLAKVTETR
jgi:glucosamine--fructose-6-phosphate aminotransferase (isomerizing)